MQRSFTTRQLTRRQGTILGVFQTGAARPTSEIIRELAEITEALEDAPVKAKVIARLTVIRTNGARTIVQVHDNASFHEFYHYFTQQGARRSTKKHLRTANRNDGIIPGAWGLEAIAAKLAKYQNQSNPILETRIRIIRKRAFKRLLTISPDQLGMLKIKTRTWHPQPRFSPLGAGKES